MESGINTFQPSKMKPLIEITSDIQNVAYEKPAAKIFFSYCSGINDYFIVWIFFNNSSSKIEGYVYYKPCIFGGSRLVVHKLWTSPSNEPC